jgi:hypothetical protein
MKQESVGLGFPINTTPRIGELGGSPETVHEEAKANLEELEQQMSLMEDIQEIEHPQRPSVTCTLRRRESNGQY